MKKLLSILLTLVMLIGMTSFSAFAATDALHIKSKADWNNFANAVTAGDSYAGKTVYLDADISISKPAGIFEAGFANPFCGTFDGRGHTLSLNITYGTNGNPYTNIGIFGYTNGATIRNLNVTGKVTGQGGVGSIAGYAVNTSFADCTNAANVQSERAKYTGGIAGYAGGCTFSNCINSGSVNGTEAVGGIAGFADNKTSFVNCVNNGAISGKKYIGGILGDTPLDESASVLAANCINYGSITASANGDNAGGIAGRMSYCGTVKNCFTCGEVSDAGTSGIVVGWANRSFSCENCYYLLLDANNGMEAINHDSGIDCPAAGIKSVYNADALNALNKCASDNGWKHWLPEKETLTFTSDGKYPTYNQYAESIIWSLDDSGLLTILGSGEIDDYEDTRKIPWSDYNLQKDPIRSVVIGDGVTGIGESAFESCSSLSSVTIPGSVTSIGDHAFDGCTKLASVKLSDGLTSIGDYAFNCCKSLTDVSIPGSVKSIGDYAFDSCTKLASAELPDGLTSIGDYAFSHCDSLSSVSIPGSVTSLGKSAFAACDRLSSAVIPGSVKSLSDTLFDNCRNLKSVTIGNGITSIGGSTFFRCDSLSSVDIPDSVTYIGQRAFEFCNNLRLVRLGSGITKIDTVAFGNEGSGIVYYNGTRAQWKQVAIETWNNFLKNSVIVYKDERTVTYDPNGGEGAPEMQIKAAGTALTLSKTVPTREGYTFLGWAAAPDAAQAQYQPGGSYNEDADITLYAVWAVIASEGDPAEDEGIAGENIEEAPVEEAPVEEVPTEEAPIEEAPIEEAPIEEAPVEEVPAEEPPVEDNAASVLSIGSLWIVIGVAVVAAAGVGTLVIVKRKRNP